MRSWCKRGAIRRHQPRDRYSVPRRYPDFPGKSFSSARTAATALSSPGTSRRWPLPRSPRRPPAPPAAAQSHHPGEGSRQRPRSADTHPPAVEKMPVHDRFAHGRAAEYHGLGQQQARVGRKIDLDRAAQPDLIEQDRFLRQPGQRAAGTDVELDADSVSGPSER